MNCQEARAAFLALAEGMPSADDQALHFALSVHVAACLDCRMRLDRLTRALLFDPSLISCAECERHLHRYAETEMAGGSAPLKFPDVSRHLQACPDCETLYRAVKDELAVLIAELQPSADESRRPRSFVAWGRGRFQLQLIGVTAMAVVAAVIGISLGRLQFDKQSTHQAGVAPQGIATPPATVVAREGVAPSPRSIAMAPTPTTLLPGTTQAADLPPVVPVAYIITLVAPTNGEHVKGALEFLWEMNDDMHDDELFAVVVCEGVRCTPDTSVLRTRERTASWCPDGEEGIYRWQIRIVGASGEGHGSDSPIYDFIWDGGVCGLIVGNEGTLTPEQLAQATPTAEDSQWFGIMGVPPSETGTPTPTPP